MSQRDRKALDAGRRKIARTANIIDGPKKSDGHQPYMVLKTDADIDKVAPQMTPMPSERQNISKIRKKFTDISLGPDERLCLVDSSSFAHAIDAETDLPDFADFHMPPKSIAGW